MKIIFRTVYTINKHNLCCKLENCLAEKINVNVIKTEYFVKETCFTRNIHKYWLKEKISFEIS